MRVLGSTNHPATDVRVVGNDLYCLQAEYTENSEWGWTADKTAQGRMVRYHAGSASRSAASFRCGSPRS